MVWVKTPKSNILRPNTIFRFHEKLYRYVQFNSISYWHVQYYRMGLSLTILRPLAPFVIVMTSISSPVSCHVSMASMPLRFQGFTKAFHIRDCSLQCVHNDVTAWKYFIGPVPCVFISQSVSKLDFWCALCWHYGHAFQQRDELPVVWYATKPRLNTFMPSQWPRNVSFYKVRTVDILALFHFKGYRYTV